MEKGVTSVKYAQEIVTANDIMADNESAISALREQMNDAKARIYNSSEYNMMKKRFEKIEKLTQQVKSYKNSKIKLKIQIKSRPFRPVCPWRGFF